MTDASTITLVRSLCLFAPLALAGGCFFARSLVRLPPASRGLYLPETRLIAALLLGGMWNLWGLVVVNVVAMHFGWWQFHAEGGLFMDIPLDLLLGWVILWGIIPTLALQRVPVPLVIGLMAWLDLLLMPHCEPVLQLGPHWLWGEGMAISLCLLPGALLARWTLHDTCLYGRASLQFVLFAGTLFGLIPASVIEISGQPLQLPTWRPMMSLITQTIFLAAIPGVSALQEFAMRGKGTPLPFDPPKRLVISGIYAYIANPMQTSMAAVFLTAGLLFQHALIFACGLMAIVYSMGLAAWDEAKDLERFGAPYKKYRANVRAWIPSWRPYYDRPARVYLAENCGICSELRRWLESRRPHGLIFCAAEDHPTQDLSQIAYDPGDGSEEEHGIAGLARCLEHINFAYAMVGITIRLPILRQFLQLVVDAGGGGPRRICRRKPLETPLNAGSSDLPTSVS